LPYLSHPFLLRILTAALAGLAGGGSLADTIFVEARQGSDTNPGTAQLPLQTLARAAELVNARTEPGPTTILVMPGIYALARSVTFENRRAYTSERPLTIEASVLPGDARWTPASMPAILSIEDPRQTGLRKDPTQTYGLKVKMGHVVIRGLKFLGSPLPDNWYCPLECLDENISDVLVTQCLFAGAPGTMEIYCAVITDGHRFVVDHCVFLDCHACAVFWDGGRGVVGKGNAMRYCIVDGARISGVWTCDTGEDFEFHHNIITRSKYFWMRKRGAGRTYLVRDCVVTENEHYSGYGVESGPTGQTGSEVTFREERVIKEGRVKLETSWRSGHYMKISPEAPGSALKAGLFE
jgi:hypothetical protein